MSQAASAALVVLAFGPLKAWVARHILPGQVVTAGWIALATCSVLCAWVFAAQIRHVAWFVWACFLRPLGKTETQADRLNAFYNGQADVCA